jgi:hypothetical protein
MDIGILFGFGGQPFGQLIFSRPLALFFLHLFYKREKGGSILPP